MTDRNEIRVSGKKVGNDKRKVEETKMQKLKNEETTVCYPKRNKASNWQKEKIMQQQLQEQVEELHRNIQHLRVENECLRYVMKRCCYPSEQKTTSERRVSLHFMIRATYYGKEWLS